MPPMTTVRAKDWARSSWLANQSIGAGLRVRRTGAVSREGEARFESYTRNQIKTSKALT